MQVANDYNVALVTALAGMLTAPADISAAECAKYVPNYPWSKAS